MHTRSIFLVAALSASCALLAQQQRQLFDDGWTFTQNGQTVSVNLPHDWDIYTAPDPEHGSESADHILAVRHQMPADRTNPWHQQLPHIPQQTHRARKL